MKYMPYFMAFLGFFLSMLFLQILGKVFHVEWLMLYFYREAPSNGIIFESGMSLIPFTLAVFFGFLGWKIGKRNFSK